MRLSGRSKMKTFVTLKARYPWSHNTMGKITKGVLFLTFLIWCILTLGCVERKVDFSTEVKPILNKNCIGCHGGVKRNGGFSVLFRDDALDTTESGKHAIVPGNPAQSEMIRRITLENPEERMPYKKEPLSQEDIETLKRWIAQGANWGDHWAYVPVKPVEIPGKRNKIFSGLFQRASPWPQNELDYFIEDKLNQMGLEPSPKADKATLMRRVFLDITGVPPTPEEAKMYLHDEREGAYEHLVDQLLASPQYGEKWATWWLDLARYADTKGYEKDGGRNIWRYRDWVIQALNEDMPFDQFTLEQLAGDLLTNSTDNQFIATGFHRNTMNNDEGGTDDEEFRVSTVFERVNTTFEIWQSTTMGCVQCHSHPYDPFKQAEYYKLFAIFNNTRDEDTEGEHPKFRVYEEKNLDHLNKIKNWVSQYGGAKESEEVVRFLKTLEPKIHPHNVDQFVNGELIDTKWLGIRHGGSARLPTVNLSEKDVLLIDYWANTKGGKLMIRLDSLKGERLGEASLPETKGRKVVSIPLKKTEGKHDLFFIFSNSSLSPNQTVCGIEWFSFRKNLPGRDQIGHLETVQSFLDLLNANVDGTPILIENTTDQFRTSYVFERGNWLLKGKAVTPGLPRFFASDISQQPQNRLELAHWLVDTNNPLTSRTIVNRIWDQIFGNGIVSTLEDFGTQGDLPSHPEMLDWLAYSFMHDGGWRLKTLIKTLVMSATYQQDSRISKEAMEIDPLNRFLSHGPRFRLSSEQIRDQALKASGLLSGKMFGKSVMPRQPEGIWQSVYNGATWNLSEGEDQYRRGIYTYAKRTSPYPFNVIFDGSSREVCVGKKIRTNTPMQALVTLNDPVFQEASRYLARKMMKQGNDREECIRKGYFQLLFKPIPESKLKPLVELYDEAKKEFEKEENGAMKFLNSETNDKDWAAMTVVANALLNLDEVLTKE